MHCNVLVTAKTSSLIRTIGQYIPAVILVAVVLLVLDDVACVFLLVVWLWVVAIEGFLAGVVGSVNEQAVSDAKHAAAQDQQDLVLLHTRRISCRGHRSCSRTCSRQDHHHER